MRYLTVRVIGGLGNQLNCYAFGRSLAARKDATLRLDAESGYWGDPFGRVYLLHRFERIRPEYACVRGAESWGRHRFTLALKAKMLLSKYLPLPLQLAIRETPPLRYRADIYHADFWWNPYFMGYWASYRYYVELERELREELKPPSPTHEAAFKSLSQIKAVRSCFVHWRSYKEDTSCKYPELHRYYQSALSLMAERVPGIVFFIFSDDPDEARRLFDSRARKVVYVNHQGTGANTQIFDDFFLMYSCEHGIIGNSTFSWWAAWLSDSVGKLVIAPGGVSPWGTDWVPPHWVTIDPNGLVTRGLQ